MLTLKTSALLETLYGGKFVLKTQSLKPNCLAERQRTDKNLVVDRLTSRLEDLNS